MTTRREPGANPDLNAIALRSAGISAGSRHRNQTARDF